MVLESLPDSSSGAADVDTKTQAASSSTAAEAGKSAAGIKAKQSLGKRRPSAAASKACLATEVVEISDDEEHDFVSDAKISRARH